MELLKKVFKSKDKKTVYMLVIMLSLGVALLLFSMYLKAEGGGAPANDGAGGQTETADTRVPGESMSASEIEGRLAEILSLVDRAGRVEVMINYGTGAETVVARNTVTEESESKEADSGGGTREQSQTKTQSTVTSLKQKDGTEEPLVLYENPPKVEGVIIVAEGGGDVLVKDALTRAASSLLGVPLHKVEVLRMTPQTSGGKEK